MSDIRKSAVLMKKAEHHGKGHDTIFSLFIMTKIDWYLQNKLWMLLSPMTTIGSYPNNKLLMPLSPIHRNYSKIITNNGPNGAIPADVEESTVYNAMLQSTLALLKHLSTLMECCSV